jgi:hypothetical protein
MSLAPKWAKAAAVLGLKMQLDVLKVQFNLYANQLEVSQGLRDLLANEILKDEEELARIEAMKD